MFLELLQQDGLSLERLHSFLVVAESGSIAKAAARLASNPRNVDALRSRQALISRQIRELEQFTKAELTERRGKTIAITEAGARFASLIRQQFQALDDFQRNQVGERRAFSIATGGSLLEWLVAPQMPALMKVFPNSTLRLESARTAELVERVRDGRLDFAIVRDNSLPEGSRMESLGRTSYLLVVPNALAKTWKLPERPRPLDVARLPLALQASGGNFHKVMTEAFAESGTKLDPAVECTSFLQVRATVESGACAGILPMFFAARLNPARYRFVALPFLAPYVRKLVLHWNPRQMERRGVSDEQIKAIALALRVRASETPQP